MKDHPLLVAAGRFHGHIGPFVAIGLRMGALANELLGRDPMGMEAEVRVEPRPPRSCVVDGIQYATGCTMGKRNISITEAAHEVCAVFSLHDKSVTLRLRQGFLERMERDLAGKPEKAVVDYAFRIMDTASDEILEVLE